MSIPFPQPSPLLIVPGLQIDWDDASNNGLSYFRSFGDGMASTPLYSRAPQSVNKELPIGTVSISDGVSGNCLNGTTAGGSFGVTASNSFAFGSSGTVMLLVRANFSPTDGVTHIAFSSSNVAATTYYIIQKNSANNWLCGWVNASTDMRPTGSASGTYTAGNVFAIFNKWQGGTTTASTWVAGKRVANTAPATVSVPGAQAGFEIGNQTTASISTSWWATDAGNQIYLVGVWDRALTDDEIQNISFAPTTLLKGPDYFNALIVPTPVTFSPAWASIANSIVQGVAS